MRDTNRFVQCMLILVGALLIAAYVIYAGDGPSSLNAQTPDYRAEPTTNPVPDAH